MSPSNKTEIQKNNALIVAVKGTSGKHKSLSITQRIQITEEQELENG